MGNIAGNYEELNDELKSKFEKIFITYCKDKNIRNVTFSTDIIDGKSVYYLYINNFNKNSGKDKICFKSTKRLMELIKKIERPFIMYDNNIVQNGMSDYSMVVYFVYGLNDEITSDTTIDKTKND
jgi:hypothetical protein